MRYPHWPEAARNWQQFVDRYVTTSRTELYGEAISQRLQFANFKERHFRTFNIRMEELMKIRMKTDHRVTFEVDMEQKAAPPDFRWKGTDRINGFTIYYSADVWELVPEERWEDVSVNLIGRSIMFDYMAESSSPCRSVHTCTLPENHRFVTDLAGRITIQRKIAP